MKWFRFYHDALDDPKVQRLPGDTFKFWVNLLCLASRSDERGLITKSIEDIAFDLRVRDDEAAAMLADLIARGLIEEHVEGIEPHNWDKRQFKSDNVSERVAEHRARQKDTDVTLHETLHVTDGETLKPSVNTDSQNYRDTEVLTHTDGADAPGVREPTPKPARYTSDFETFWQAYPSGHGVKKQAFEQWRKIPASERQAVMDGLAAWMTCDRWQRGYVKDAQRWLRDRQWQDEPPAAPASMSAVTSDPDAPIIAGPRGFTPDQLRRLAEQERRRETA